ncbi:MAG: hypothetical protein H9791_00995 [Candidatus Bacteroides intestinipullorum]|uniref:Uncharacterized protein n=1 Tax=Candidatus Bacteroides intestinipullorum TaxID=2838471 RepID=A0A9E2KEK4_9BACE|nr:hypothetical protein [Candidatus Bacteroides intestinipullorum]
MEIDKIRNLLNLFFMLLALLAVVFYFAMDDQRWFLYTCGTAIVVKMAESFIRFMKITKPDNKLSNYDKRRYHQTRKPGLSETDTDER